MANDRGTPDASPGGEAAATYRIFGTCIHSYFPLPELPACRAVNPAITVRKVTSGQLDLVGFTTCHDWRRDEGPPICTSARRGGDYLLSFPGRAHFHIAPGAVISGLPCAGVGDEEFRHLLLSQVVPRFLGHTGELLLHASAATLRNGKTVAFLGETGHGKSTLAAYCHQQGAEIIDDDCIHLRFDGSSLCVTGGVPAICLYPDSRLALVPDATGPVSNRGYAGKQQMRLAPASTAGPEARTLDALFLLAAPGDAAAVDTAAVDTAAVETAAGAMVHIEPAGGQAAMMAILSSAFTLDPSDPDTMVRTFEQAGRILQNGGGLRVQCLSYPRQYDQLEYVLEVLVNHLRA